MVKFLSMGRKYPHRVRVLILALLSWALIMSCDVAMGTPVAPPTSTPTLDPQVQIDQAVAATMTAQAQIALAVQETLTAVANVLPLPTNTPQFTLTPSLSGTPTLTPTSENPLVSVSIDTRCRTGPGAVYDIVGVLEVGQTAEVIGRSHNSDNWIIKLPENPSLTCWLWAFYATVVGDTTALPVIPWPPTPTPP